MKILFFIISFSYLSMAKTYDFCCKCSVSKFKGVAKTGLLMPMSKNLMNCSTNDAYSKLAEDFYRHNKDKDPKFKEIIRQTKERYEKSNKKPAIEIAGHEPFHISFGRPDYWITSKEKCLLVQKEFILASRKSPAINYETCEELYKAAIKE